MSTAVTRVVAPEERRAIPPLQNGDRLTVEEFERRYDAMPNLKKAELIDGIVYMGAAEGGGMGMSSPVSHDYHGSQHFDVITWLGMYRVWTPGVDGGDNSSLRLLLGSMPQPDAFLRVLPSHGGLSSTDEDGYNIHAPELIVEVAASSVSFDVHVKQPFYARCQVQEYLVWRAYDREFDWYELCENKYVEVDAPPEGVYRSKVFPGLWLDAAALIRRDMLAVAQVATQGHASPEHAVFIERLKAAAAQKSS